MQTWQVFARAINAMYRGQPDRQAAADKCKELLQLDSGVIGFAPIGARPIAKGPPLGPWIWILQPHTRRTEGQRLWEFFQANQTLLQPLHVEVREDHGPFPKQHAEIARILGGKGSTAW